MILVVDNYDSFTYNLVQYIGELGGEMQVFRNDAISVAEVLATNPTHIVLSPGPCTPNEAGICLDLIPAAGKTIPLLGVCLGLQAIGQAFGASVVRADRVMHGKTSPVHHDGTGLHENLPNPFTATRYHSLVLNPETIPGELRVNAWSDGGTIMGIEHREFPIFGVQYHPESIMTEGGKELLAKFLQQRGGE
ncbi:MAG: aminodeoxychorismate/anthranilate synthase component II [Ignavibacteriae bacterium]|nr:aminodeoxychorismate/anthranilate synthase component II [Ignavibacteriota bacterium]MCB9216085.1 aminodeoxychorismate/anthranilate synthase component II [Ignavibacteria bacterium]